METQKPKVYVGLPNYAEVMDRRVVLNRIGLARRWERLGIDFDISSSGRTFIHFARTEFGIQTIEQDYTHLLFMDDDAIVTPDFFEAWLEADVDIIGAPYVDRKPPFDMCVKRLVGVKLVCLEEDELDQGIIPVAAVGTHAMLIKTSVFTSPANPSAETLNAPESDLQDRMSFVEEHNAGRPLFSMPKQGTEDMFFCHRAIRKGFGVYCDTNRFAGHIGSPPVLGIDNTREERKQWQSLSARPSTPACGP